MHNAAATTAGGGALGAIDRAMHALEKFTALISGLGIFGLMLLGVVQIFGRKFFNAPIFGYIDIVEIAMSALVFLGLAYTERLGGHIRMELIVTHLRGRWQWMFELIGVILGLIIVAVLIFYSWEHAMRAYRSGDSTIDAQYVLWPSKMIVPVSLALLSLRLMISLWGYLRLLSDPDAAPIAVPEVIDVEEQALRDAEAAGVDVERGIAPDGGRSG
ncbi:MAG: TRAP transporter small permease [Hyphomicrobiaceae bacterium]|nr:MAG: TRAP transporter small permease [Hyphomicrobiaceae bacterium]